MTNRTFLEIQQSVLDSISEASELSALEILTESELVITSADSTSRAAVWRQWVWATSFSIWLHEQMVSQNALNSRPGPVRWYRELAFSFLDGLPLVWIDGRYQYDLTGVLDVEERRVIDCCAVDDDQEGTMVIKVATIVDGVRQKLPDAVKERFVFFMELTKYGGTYINCISNDPDELKINITAEVDPLIIDLATGKLLNVVGDVYPVKDALENYLSNLEFNGTFVREFFRDELQKATGVKLPIINNIQWKYAALPFVEIGQRQMANSGYFKILPENLIINYLPYDVANY